MNLINYLNQNVRVKVDRPLGSKHAKHGFIYPVNYGFVPDTISGDGEELDCYVLGVFEPLNEFTGKCIAIIHRINDNDDKLIIVPENRNFSNKEIDVLIEFQERFFKHEIIRENIEFNSLIPELSVSNIETSKKFYKNLGFKKVELVPIHVREYYETKEDLLALLLKTPILNEFSNGNEDFDINMNLLDKYINLHKTNKGILLIRRYYGITAIK